MLIAAYTGKCRDLPLFMAGLLRAAGPPPGAERLPQAAGPSSGAGRSRARASILEGGSPVRYLTIESIYLCQVRCPECGRQSYILNWQPEKCPHCRADLRGYTEYELAACDRLLTLEIDRITGHVCTML